ncbi:MULTISPECIES: hypothetical protein [unclassified Streptomyces]|uniref:hypothetical protein n=1 Tax=unclassified Streptomyces TaxID=2593676 RepID=UPI000938DBC3|nr:hypothetical protein [Streptomyces sp. CB01883]OKJ81877.1 hypothetical protein AMK32_21040 [Streptomyces sp. CB01883]
MAEHKSSSTLTAPLHGAASALRKVPGAGVVGRAAEGTLDKVGAVSPRGRRMAVYAGAGLLGAAGVVEWPVALTGAAVAWLTQPRPSHLAEDAPVHRPEPAHDVGGAALRSGRAEPGRAEPAEPGRAEPGEPGRAGPGRGAEAASGTEGAMTPGGARRSGHARPPHPEPSVSTEPKPAPGPLGPTARPDRTTL